MKDIQVEITLRHNRNNAAFLKVFKENKPIFLGFSCGYNFPSWKLEMTNWIAKKEKLPKSCTVISIETVCFTEQRMKFTNKDL